MQYHIVAFVLGFILDLILGDPQGLPHPIRYIGSLIHTLDMAFLGQDHPVTCHENDDGSAREKQYENKKQTGISRERFLGKMTVVIVLLITCLIVSSILVITYRLHIYLGILTEAVMTWWILAVKSLRSESMKVYTALKARDIEGARYAVSMIVGRDTKNLNEEEITRAAVETIAENTSDGVIAPLLYLALGGPILGFFYKAVNTMDSMIGYKNERYRNFGRAAAKLDDIVNYLPARVSAYLMILSSWLGRGTFDAKEAYRIYKRDRLNHSSPNSAQTESVCAGALRVRLAGPSYYFGQLIHKPYIGDDTRSIEVEDIKKANILMFRTALLAEILLLILMCSFYYIWNGQHIF